MHNLSFVTRKDPVTGKPFLPEGKRKVFISYKHSDEEVLPLCEKLAEHILSTLDVAIWYDHKLTAGKEYDEEIRSAIKQSDAFILLLTPNVIKSKYVLEQEVPFAMKQQVAIIPIIAGISKNDISSVEKIIGRVHMPIWFFGIHTQIPDFNKDAKDQFLDGLKLAVANKDFIEQARLFYKKGYQNVSMRNLTPEQIFIKAYGNLFGVDSETDKSIGIKLMESVFGMYCDDKDFTDLQEQVAYELLSHFYRTNQPELFFAYMKSAIDKGYERVLPLLFNVYSKQWHSEMLCCEFDFAIMLLDKIYFDYNDKCLNIDDLISVLPKSRPQKELLFIEDNIRIGELTFDGHSAYFQKSNIEKNAINLIVDNYCIEKYNNFVSGWGNLVYLFMAYDIKHHAIITLYTESDFDHYSP